MSTTLDKKGDKKMSKEIQKEIKPKIPVDILDEFIAKNISSEDKKSGFKVKSHFLWENGGIERYRINLWMEKNVEGQFCNRNYIAYSWFTHFHRREKTLIDKTIIQEKDDGKKHYY